MQTQKVNYNPYIYAKATNNPEKLKKSMSIVWSHDRCRMMKKQL